MVICGPVLTEKSALLLSGSRRVYVFKVFRGASKICISRDIEKLFSVKPVSCTVVNVPRKRCPNLPYSRKVKKGSGFASSYKKAYVTLEDGQVIPEFEA